MLTAQMIKDKAKELGATVCGIGCVYDESDIQRDPRMILPIPQTVAPSSFALSFIICAVSIRSFFLS